MSETLKTLIEKEKLEIIFFKMDQERYMQAVDKIVKMNDLIVEQAKKEGITLEQLGRV